MNSQTRDHDKDKLIMCEDVNKKQRKRIKELKTSLEDVLNYALKMQGLGEDFKDFMIKTNKAKELIKW